MGGDRLFQLFPVFRVDVLDSTREVPSHLLEVPGRVGENEVGDGLAELTTGLHRAKR
jgi:hypothetical protein